MCILDKLSMEPDGQNRQRLGEVSKGYIKKTLGEKFKHEMDLESDDETSELIFPTMFIIYMHPDDFRTRMPFFERWGPIFLSRIYSLIRKKKRRMEFRHKVLEHFGNRYPSVKYTPTDARWCIQFTVDGTVQQGEIRSDTSYSIPYKKVEYTNNGPRIVQDPNSTIKTRNPKTKVLEEQTLDGIQVLGEGIRLYPFDKTLQEDPDKIREFHPDKKNELAILQWDNFEWSMYDDYIEISGKEETRNESYILKINSNKVKRTHVAIRYRNNEFQLAAWGDTMLNERNVEVSADAANVKWEKLNPRSTIVLNNEVVLRFNAKTY